MSIKANTFTIGVAEMGMKAITGVGFQPDAVIICAAFSPAGGPVAAGSIGMGNVANQGVHGASDQPFESHDDIVILARDDLGSALVASLVSLDPDGFTINITTNAIGSPYKFRFIAMKSAA